MTIKTNVNYEEFFFDVEHEERLKLAIKEIGQCLVRRDMSDYSTYISFDDGLKINVDVGDGVSEGCDPSVEIEFPIRKAFSYPLEFEDYLSDEERERIVGELRQLASDIEGMGK
jgi:hypothetical protein